MKITACPLCGSRNIDIADMSDGSAPSLHWETKVCRDCGWTGVPLEFDSEEEYQRFYGNFDKDDYIEKSDYYVDPAEAAPIRRHIFQWFVTILLSLGILILPGFVFFLVSVYGGLSDELSILLAFLSFVAYAYIVLKRELWKIIRR